jgi:hypothetical protein
LNFFRGRTLAMHSEILALCLLLPCFQGLQGKLLAVPVESERTTGCDSVLIHDTSNTKQIARLPVWTSRVKVVD